MTIRGYIGRQQLAAGVNHLTRLFQMRDKQMLFCTHSRLKFRLPFHDDDWPASFTVIQLQCLILTHQKLKGEWSLT